MKNSRAWMVCIVSLTGVLVTASVQARGESPPTPAKPRVVYLVGQLSDEQLLVFTACVSASHQPGLLLIDSDKTTSETKRFLKNYHPDRVVPVGAFAKGVSGVEARTGMSVAPLIPWKSGQPTAVWEALVPQARRVVVCPAAPRSLLLESVCLAGALHAPLYVIHRQPEEVTDLARQLKRWGSEQVFAVAGARPICAQLPGVQVVHLSDDQSVTSTCIRHLAERRPIRNIVIANPADVTGDRGGMSVLAPWIALHRRAALLLTNAAGNNVNGLVKVAVRRTEMQKADALILVGNLDAIPMEHRANPIPGGKDAFIEMEPLTPTGTAAWSFATGRLFDEEPSQVALRLAQQTLLKNGTFDRRALVVSNVGGHLPLLEAFSRNTIQELRNSGYDTTGLVGNGVLGSQMRSHMPTQDIIVWEGHHSTLVNDYGVPSWPEPLQPSLVFLQSCLALNEVEASPFLHRGGVGVIGSSTRVFSGSGGAFTLAFFDALGYDHRTLGGSLRQAKNFLLAYSLLKEKRLGNSAKLGAANVRTAWAFTLWGDPTLRLPAPRQPQQELAPVHHWLRGRMIVLDIPEKPLPRAVSSKYSAQIVPNGRLGGLVAKEPDEFGKQLKGLVFAEVHLPKAPAGTTPVLHSHLPSRRWVFCWDERRSTGYLLVLPRAKDRGELRFVIDWTPQETVKR